MLSKSSPRAWKLVIVTDVVIVFGKVLVLLHPQGLQGLSGPRSPGGGLGGALAGGVCWLDWKSLAESVGWTWLGWRRVWLEVGCRGVVGVGWRGFWLERFGWKSEGFFSKSFKAYRVGLKKWGAEGS